MQVSIVDYFCLPSHPYDMSTLFLGSRMELFVIPAAALTFVVFSLLLNFSLVDEGFGSLL